MSQQKEEVLLIKDILNGERNRYRTLVDRYASMVFSVVNEFVSNEEEVNELAQEIFVKAYERLSSFEGNSKFSSWLYMIAKNHCRDFAKNIRRQNSRFSEMEEDDLNRRLKEDELPNRDIERKEWNNTLKKGLDSINKEYAEAFMMKYSRNMSYKAMSKRLDASVSALKVRVYRAKKQLKIFIETHN